ncbi:uncharacterized protein LOC126782545 isoform X2 [Argentina anserina]|uniref:uncharacterized protein LOC126782545 isoform X2 n=1 Tax=Argentina anserina TaxID=57926 RepID=UPI0021764E7E|nr:uncharacterized protein LOC126782545 isoform X2 [Potentilla anserina]
MQGLRSGKLKVEQEKQTVVENNCGDESGNGGVVEKKKKKVNEGVPIVGRVLRSRVVGSGGGEGGVEFGKKRRLVNNGDGKKGEEEKEGGNVGVSGRVLRSGSIAVMEDVGDVKKKKRQRLIKKGENVVDDCFEKGKEEGVDKLLSSGLVLRSRTVANGDCDKSENGGGKIESDGDKAESDGVNAENDGGGDKVDSDMGVKAEAESNGDKLESKNVEVYELGQELVGNGGGVNENKVKETEVGDKTPVAIRVLRSRTVVNGGSKAESDGAEAESSVDKGKNDGVKAESDVLKAESGVDKGKNDGVKVECNGDKAEAGTNSDMGECEHMEVAELEKKSRLVGDGGVDKTKMKGTEVGDKTPLADRVLRSRIVVNGGSMAESDGARVTEHRQKDMSQKKLSDVKNGGSIQLITGFTQNFKGKHGRPPKVNKEESGRSDDGLRQLKGKRGRPQVSEKEENSLLNGRSKKKLRSGQDKSDVLKGNLDKKCNVYFRSKSGSKSQQRLKSSTLINNSHLERKRIGKQFDLKASPQAKKVKRGRYSESEGSEHKDGHNVQKQKQCGKKKQESKSKDGRRELKQAVSEKIVKMILAAGWKIDRRPRSGRDYMDAVYVCPAGKTHWSVTKAYDALKLGCENGDPMACSSGFNFTPIPPEERSMLQRVGGDRKKKKTGGGQGKNKAKQRAKDGDASDGGVEEKKKKKLVKSLKGKHLLLENNGSTSKACQGKRSLVHRHKWQKTQNRKRCALLVRNSENADSEKGGYIPYYGKRTVLSWMIDLGTLSLNSKLKYMNKRKRQVLLEGKIARDGVHCSCCDETISLSEFVIHTGSDYSEPLRHILTDSGSSLLQCLLKSWNKQEESERRGFHFVEVTEEDPNDDTCGICGDGGDLICCDGCPSTFHKSCLEIKFPSGNWHCVYCSCKFCGMFDTDMPQRDDFEDVYASALLTCHLCEEKYHQCCFRAKDAVNGDSSSSFFCAKNCQELFEKLERLLGVRHEVEEGFTLTLLRRYDLGDTPQKVDCSSKLIECNAKLAVAFLIMDECFLPMVDHRSGVNLIHNILYNRGSNFNRLNYGGFFTAILERGDEIVSAATLRIHGNYLAEMPFIGTRYLYRRQGMCRRLLSAIESALFSLNVERLVIPAISELTETWTSVFGFKSLEESSKQKMKNMNILVFPGVDILQKPLLNQLTETNESPVKDLSFTDLEHHKIMKDVVYNTDEGPLARSDSEATVSCVHEGNVELAAVESDTQHLCSVFHDDLESKSSTIPFPIDSVCDVLKLTKEMNGYQNSTSVADMRTLYLVSKHKQPELLCDTAEGFLAGAATEATASLIHKTNEELVAVESDVELLSGVSRDNLEGENNTMTIPTGSISDAQEQTDDTQLLCGENHTYDQKEKRNEHRNSGPVPDFHEVEFGTKYNRHSMSKVEWKSDLHSECTDSAREVCGLGQGTKNIDHKVTIDDDNVKPLGLHDEGFLHPCTENNATELQMVSSVHAANHSSETIVCTDSEITTQVTHDARDHANHDSQHFLVERSISYPDVKTLETFVENNHSCIQHTSVVTAGVHPESERSDSRILTKTSQVDGDEFCQATRLTHEKVDDSKGHSTTLLFGCSITCISGNGQDTHKVASTTADDNSHSLCGANIESDETLKAPDAPGVNLDSNGNSKSPDVSITADDNSHSLCGVNIESDETSKATDAPVVGLTSCGANIDSNGNSKSPDVSTTADDNSHSLCGVNTESYETSNAPCVELTSCGHNINSNGIAKSPDVPAVNLSSCGTNIYSNGNAKSPVVPGVEFSSEGDHTNTKSLQQSDFDSGVDNDSLRQLNSSNTCAAGKGNSFGASEVTILSNQGQAS